MSGPVYVNDAGAAVAWAPITPDVLEAVGVEIEHHWIADEVYSKRATIKAGATLAQHSHPYPHASALIKGRVRLEVEGKVRFINGPSMLLIEAHRVHVITALTDVVWHCLHICSDTDPLTVDQTILKG